MSSSSSSEWVILFGSSESETATALTTGLDGSIYIGGYTSGDTRITYNDDLLAIIENITSASDITFV